MGKDTYNLAKVEIPPILSEKTWIILINRDTHLDFFENFMLKNEKIIPGFQFGISKDSPRSNTTNTDASNRYVFILMVLEKIN